MREHNCDSSQRLAQSRSIVMRGEGYDECVSLHWAEQKTPRFKMQDLSLVDLVPREKGIL
jgi:hypothetical protein